MGPSQAGDTREVDLIPGQENTLEKGMATHSCIPAEIIPRTEKPGDEIRWDSWPPEERNSIRGQ